MAISKGKCKGKGNERYEPADPKGKGNIGEGKGEGNTVKGKEKATVDDDSCLLYDESSDDDDDVPVRGPTMLRGVRRCFEGPMKGTGKGDEGR